MSRLRWSSTGTSNPWLILFAVGLGQFMAVVDITVVFVALPTIAADFQATLAEMQWVIIASTLALVGFVPVFGRISDVMGRKRLFLIGIAVFTLASGLVAAAPSIYFMIAARVLQGIGAALITANVLAILVDVFPIHQRGTAIGVQAVLISFGAASGPSLGGLLVDTFGWEAVFLINVPIGIACAILCAAVLPPLKSHRSMEPMDWVGAVGLILGLVILLLGLTKAPEWGWTSTKALPLIGVGLVILVAVVGWERRHPTPIVDTSLFKIRAFSLGQVVGLCGTLTLSGTMLMVSFYWQTLHGFSPTETGLLMMPIPIAIGIASPLSGRVADRTGWNRYLVAIGLSLAAVALVLLSQTTENTPAWDVMARMAAMGIGIGMYIAPNNAAVMSAPPEARRGIGSGLLNMFRFTGQALGVALVGAAFAGFASANGVEFDLIPSPADAALVAGDAVALENFNAAFRAGFEVALLVIIPVTVIGIVASLLRGAQPLGVEGISDPSVEAVPHPSVGRAR